MYRVAQSNEITKRKKKKKYDYAVLSNSNTVSTWLRIEEGILMAKMI